MSNNTNISLRAVAEAAHVSRDDVLKVVLKQPDVSEHTRSKIFDAMKQLGFPHHQHSSSKQTEQFIGVAVPGVLKGDYIHHVVRGVEEKAQEYGLTVSVSIHNDVQQDSMVQMLADDDCRGMIFIVPQGFDRLFDLCMEYSRPCITVDYPGDKDISGASTISVNNQQAILGVMQYLATLGHRRIAFITGDLKITSARERLAGYKEAVKCLGLHDHASLIVEGDWSHHTAYLQTEELLSLSMPPTAIVASNDFSAFGAIQAINEARLMVGKHISVTGFDDLEMAGTIVPGLTTMRQPDHEMGKFAVEMLMDALQDSTRTPLHYTFDAQLVVRQSTSAPMAAYR